MLTLGVSLFTVSNVSLAAQLPNPKSTQATKNNHTRSSDCDTTCDKTVVRHKRSAGASGKKSQSATKRHKKVKRRSSTLPTNFSGIDVSGNIIVTLHSASKHTRSRVIIRAKNPYVIDATVTNHILHLRKAAGSGAGKVKVSIRLYQLKKLIATGNAVIKGKNIRVKHLTIRAGDYSRVTLDGMVGLDQLSIMGNAKVNIRWVNSDNLAVRGFGDARAVLAGSVQHLQMRLFDQSRFDGTYLRAHQVWAETHDSSTTKVLAIDSLRAFASGESNLYFYKAPKQVTRDARGEANILQLAWHR